MKKTLIVIVMLCMVFILGCTSDAINPTAEPTDSPTSPTINAATPSPTVNLGGEFTPTPSVRFCDEPDEYIRLEQFLRGFDFGDAERLELYPKRLNDGLLRASFYDKPVEAALVLLCETSDLEYLDIDLPGSMDHYTGLHAVNLRQLEINPKYDSKANNDEPYYLINDIEKFVYTNQTVILLNGYGITEASYPVLSPWLPFSLNDYIMYDINRIIEGKKVEGEPYCLYRIFYCENEILSLEQLYDIDADGRSWSYKD